MDKDHLKSSLTHLSTSVKQHTPDAELVYKTICYYCVESRVATAFYKHGNNEKTLVVIVTVPITRNKIAASLLIWKTMYFPLLAPDEQKYHTVLTGGPRYIVYNPLNIYYIVVDDLSDLPCTFEQKTNCLIRTNNQKIHLHSTKEKTCTLALFGTNLDEIKNYANSKLLLDH